MMNCGNQPTLACPIGNNRASARPMAAFMAFMKAMSLLHQVMRALEYRHIVMAIEMASKEGIFCIVFLLIVAMAAAGVIPSE